ncbi:MAG: sensor histidine kinase KdpD [Oscillospiraceae bacterium]
MGEQAAFRPDPEELLKRMNAEKTVFRQGKLKIFFGYAAGVGKTFAMLDAAHSALKSGVDVVVGYVEPHTRPETLALLDNLEQLPQKQMAYKGITLNEFDIDGALARKPQLILVDELAHTNAEGCRHTKRYADVEELLNAGIDVYTTVNVQHLESLNDIVASITHVIVRERIPDSVFDNAAQVELVDIEPDALIQRLKQGKIYKEHQAKNALDHFFSYENLAALREIALRRTADRVTREVESIKSASHANDYYTSEHILVCLSSAPSNAKVIRTAARMASAFHGSFTALFVETPGTTELNQKNRECLRSNLKLAEQLGARIATVYGEDIPFQISEYARISGISKIIIGRSMSRPRFFLNRHNFIEKLTKLAPNLDIYVIPDVNSEPKKKKPYTLRMPIVTLPDVLLSLGILTLCTLIGYFFNLLDFSEINTVTVYILGVLLIASLTKGRTYGIAASVFSVLTFNFFFTEPRFTLDVYDAGYPVTFLVMLSASLITSTLTMRVKNQAKISAINAHRTGVLFETSQRLHRAKDIDDIVRKSVSQAMKLLGKPVIFYLVKDGSLVAPVILNTGNEPLDAVYTSADEQAVAAWVMNNRKSAGVSTDTLPGAKAWYLPVASRSAVLAVVGIVLSSREEVLPFERSLLIAMLNEMSFAIEKNHLNEMQKETQMLAEKERLRANLLRAISHDLRTPLTSISGSTSILMTDGNAIDAGERKRLLGDIYDDSLWLINLVENLLSVTRIDNGSMSIKTNAELVDELIAEALLHIDRHKSEHAIHVHTKDDLMMVNADASLMIQVLVNIIDNAIKYTEKGSEINITAFRRKNKAVIEIADNGAGISDADKAHIFDMFFTSHASSGDNRRGLGLGLALCKSIVTAHGGEIYVKDNKNSGTIFGFSLELVEVRTLEAPLSNEQRGGCPR